MVKLHPFLCFFFFFPFFSLSESWFFSLLCVLGFILVCGFEECLLQTHEVWIPFSKWLKSEAEKARFNNLISFYFIFLFFFQSQNTEKGRLWIIAAMSQREINMLLKMLWSGYTVGMPVPILLPHYKCFVSNLFCLKGLWNQTKMR